MRRPSAPSLAIVQPRAGMALIGLLSWASAAVSALLAWDHAVLRGPICGLDRTPHCAWCAAAAGFAIAGLAAFRASAR